MSDLESSSLLIFFFSRVNKSKYIIMSDNDSGSGNETSGTVKNNRAPRRIHKVSVKNAPFNRDDPEIWFMQLEAQFGLAGVTTDNTKYSYLVAAMDNETVKCVRDKLLNPPNADKYESLKRTIIDRLCDSAKAKLNRLLSGMQLGDRKPSQLLREMQTLATEQITGAALQTMWLQRLPLNAQQILSGMEDVGLEKLATAADKVLEVQRPAEINSVAKSDSSHRHVSPSSSGTIAELQRSNAMLQQTNAKLLQRIDSLTKQFSNLSSDFYDSGNSRSRSHFKHTSSSALNDKKQRQRSRSRSAKQVEQFPNCWYHWKFGKDANNCIKPCNFTSEN